MTSVFAIYFLISIHTTCTTEYVIGNPFVSHILNDNSEPQRHRPGLILYSTHKSSICFQIEINTCFTSIEIKIKQEHIEQFYPCVK